MCRLVLFPVQIESLAPEMEVFERLYHLLGKGTLGVRIVHRMVLPCIVRGRLFFWERLTQSRGN